MFSSLRYPDRFVAVGDAGRPAQDGGAELLGLVQPEVREPHSRVAGVGHLEPQFGESENTGKQGLYDVDGLHPVQAGLALLFEQETGIDPDVALGKLIAREVPAQEEGSQGQQQHHAAPGQQP